MRLKAFNERLRLLACPLADHGIYFHLEIEENLSRSLLIEAAMEALPDSFINSDGSDTPIAAACTAIEPMEAACNVYYIGSSTQPKLKVGKIIVAEAQKMALRAEWIGDPNAAVWLSLCEP